jgi:hypothetical protein
MEGLAVERARLMAGFGGLAVFLGTVSQVNTPVVAVDRAAGAGLEAVCRPAMTNSG